MLQPNIIRVNTILISLIFFFYSIFWGKFGEKPNKTQTKTVTTHGELFDIIDEAGNNIHDIRICTEDVVEVDVSKVEEEIIPSNKTNIFIAAFTTAWARLEL